MTPYFQEQGITIYHADCLPEPEKIRELIKELETFTKVHLKPNLERLLPEIKL